MNRLECNVVTGEIKTVTLTVEEEASALSMRTSWDELNTVDARAIKAVDGMDRLQFEHLFDLENRTRALEFKTQITKEQYRTALINRWKSLNL